MSCHIWTSLLARANWSCARVASRRHGYISPHFLNKSRDKRKRVITTEETLCVHSWRQLMHKIKVRFSAHFIDSAIVQTVHVCLFLFAFIICICQQWPMSLFIRKIRVLIYVYCNILLNTLRYIIMIGKLPSLSSSLEFNHRKLLILRGSSCHLPIVCCSEIKCKTDLLSCVDVCIPFTSVLVFIVCAWQDNIERLSIWSKISFKVFPRKSFW